MLYDKKNDYNEIVGITKKGEIVVLEYTFAYKGEDGLSGATGYSMEPLTQNMLDTLRDPDTIAEYWQDCVANGQTTEGLNEWAEHINEEYNDRLKGYSVADDPSFRCEMDEAYEKLTAEQKERLDKAIGKLGTDFIDWSVVGCGRCIPTEESEYSLLLNPELLKEIKAHESKRDEK